MTKSSNVVRLKLSHRNPMRVQNVAAAVDRALADNGGHWLRTSGVAGRAEQIGHLWAGNTCRLLVMLEDKPEPSPAPITTTFRDAIRQMLDSSVASYMPVDYEFLRLMFNIDTTVRPATTDERARLRALWDRLEASRSAETTKAAHVDTETEALTASPNAQAAEMIEYGHLYTDREVSFIAQMVNRDHTARPMTLRHSDGSAPYNVGTPTQSKTRMQLGQLPADHPKHEGTNP